MMRSIKSVKFNPARLEQVLAEKAMTQSELNKMAGFPNQNTVNKIIKGGRQVTATELLRFARILNVSPESFSVS